VTDAARGRVHLNRAGFAGLAGNTEAIVFQLATLTEA